MVQGAASHGAGSEPTGDAGAAGFNPYAPPVSEGLRSDALEITGGVEFRGELTDDDRQRASQLHGQGVLLVVLVVLAIALSPLLLALFFQRVEPIVLGAICMLLLGVCLKIVWHRYRWWLTLELELPPGAFHGRAAATGLAFESPGWSVKRPWRDVAGYRSDAQLILLYVDDRALGIPRHALASDQAWAKLCETLLLAQVRQLG